MIYAHASRRDLQRRDLRSYRTAGRSRRVTADDSVRWLSKLCPRTVSPAALHPVSWPLLRQRNIHAGRHGNTAKRTTLEGVYVALFVPTARKQRVR